MECSLQVCETRDVKGMYKKAKEGLIKEFTGISSPYEEPDAPELVIDSSRLNLEEAVNRVIDLLRNRGILHPQSPQYNAVQTASSVTRE